MNRVSLLLPLLQLCSIGVCQIDQNQQQILYIKRSSISQCPNGTQITECQTLDWFIEHFNILFTSNTKMLFEEGLHMLNNAMTVDNSHNFTISGEGSVLHSKDGLPQPTSKIYCDNVSSVGLFFSNSSNISIKNLEIKFCSGLYDHDEWRHVSASLIFDSVQNVSLDQVFISNAKGYGLYAKDVFDLAHVVDSAFLNCTKHPNFRHSGNVLFKFSSQQHSFTSILLDSSWFMYGATSYHRSSGAGGLTIDIHSPNINVTIFNVTAKGNTGGIGGNIALFLIIFDVNSSSIAIKNSHIINGHAIKGAGLAFWSKQSLECTEYDNSDDDKYFSDRNILTICKTNFSNNSAIGSGGAMYMAHYNQATVVSHLKQVTITNCTFTENGGKGSSVDIIQHSLQPMTPFLNTSFVLCNFTNNRLANDDGAVVAICSDKVSLVDCTFTGSSSTAISLSNAYLNLYGKILFENNTANLGGAMKINEASLIFVQTGTHVRFIDNKAKKGGAIYVKTSCIDTPESTFFCFFQPVPLYDMPVSEFTKRMTLEFVNNSAKVSGDALYGGDLDNCSTTLPYRLNNSQHQKYFWYSTKIFYGIFDMKRQHGSSKISSDPRKACFCSHESQSNSSCTTIKDPIEKYPGQELMVSIVTVGQMESSTQGKINVSLVNEMYPSHRLFSISHSELTDKCVNLSYVLKSNRSHAQLSFAPETAGIYCNITRASLTVHLLPCPLGFQLTDTAPYICSCDPLLSKFLMFNLQVMCSISNQTVSVPQKAIWFGCFNQERQNQSSLSCDSLVVVSNCEHYCRNAENNSTTVEVSLTDLDKQCSDGHTGIMCGACKLRYSRVLGELMKCQKDCTNINLPFILVAFLASGFLLLIIIRVLNLTVTEGTINGLLVYTMVIQTHYSYFSENLSAFGQVCWVFISWINLTLGIRACFYRGMDAYEQIWTLFGQAVFSFLFLFMIVLLGRKFIFFTRLLGRNIIKVLATLVAMMYSNLLYATFITFQPAILHISMTNGTQFSKTVWYYDGSIPYLGLKHAPLFITALMCSLFILYLMCSLLFIQCLQKRSALPCLRWVERLRPFYEAYTGPCRDHYRFWPGFLLFIRTGLFIMNSLIPSHIDTFFRIKMLITAVVFVLVISLACISPQGVYKRWPINILEFSFYLNLCFTSGFLGLNYNKHKNISAVYTSVSIAAFTFFGILAYHCYSQIKNTRVWKKLTTWMTVQAKFKHNQERQLDENEGYDERDLLLPQAFPPVLRFDYLREPLVEA